MSETPVGSSRRELLGWLRMAPAVAALPAIVRAAEGTGCVNLDALPASQKSMRKSLGFVLHTDDPKKHCATCTFFTAGAGGCGACQLLSGGAVATDSVCGSWAAKS